MGVYLRPHSLSEAVEALSNAPLTVLAGGTDFYPARVGRARHEDQERPGQKLASPSSGLDAEA